MDIEEFDIAIQRIFKMEHSSSTKVYLNYRYEYGDIEFRLKKKKYRDAVNELEKLTLQEDFEIYNDNRFEVSVSRSGRLFSSGDFEISQEDIVNNIHYSLSNPSDAYLILIIKQIHEISDSTDIIRNMFPHGIRNRTFLEKSAGSDLFSILKIIARLNTLQIKSINKKNHDEFETLSYAFLFNLSFNADLAFLPASFIEGLTRRIRIGRLRRAKVDDIEPPKRKYENDLILFYQKGISSESVDLQYLSFYHILEHFFEKIYNDELIKSIKTELTKPSFSYKRNKDVTGLIKVIQHKLKYKNEEFQINEPEALKLVLDRFILDFESVKTEIEGYDPSLLDYYKQHEVTFSNGNKVNFNEHRDSILKNLQERIYKTRNSIVHSKETDRNRYLPFKHDKILRNEIMLMRVIAEKIVIESSKEL